MVALGRVLEYTTYQSSIGINPFQVVYGRLPPPLICYGDVETPDSTVDQ